MGFGIWWRSQCGSASCLACGVSRAGYCHHTLCPQPVAVGPQLFNKSDQLGGKVPDCLGSARQSCLQPETPSNTFRITLGVIESCKCSTGPWGTARAPPCPRSISCWACTGGMPGCRGHGGHSLLSHGRLYACPWVCHAGLRQGCFRLFHCGSGEVLSDLLLKSRHWPNPSGRILTHQLILCWVLGSWGWWRDAQT